MKRVRLRVLGNTYFCEDVFSTHLYKDQVVAYKIAEMTAKAQELHKQEDTLESMEVLQNTLEGLAFLDDYSKSHPQETKVDRVDDLLTEAEKARKATAKRPWFWIADKKKYKNIEKAERAEYDRQMEAKFFS